MTAELPGIFEDTMIHSHRILCAKLSACQSKAGVGPKVFVIDVGFASSSICFCILKFEL